MENSYAGDHFDSERGWVHTHQVFVFSRQLCASVSRSKPSSLLCHNIKTTACWEKYTGKIHKPPLAVTIVWPLRATHAETPTHTPSLTCVHSIQFSLLSSPKWSCSQLIEANKCTVSFSFKRKELSGFPLDKVMSILVYFIPLLQELSPSKLMVLFREWCLSQSTYLIELVTFFQRTILHQEMLFHWNWKF